VGYLIKMDYIIIFISLIKILKIQYLMTVKDIIVSNMIIYQNNHC